MDFSENELNNDGERSERGQFNGEVQELHEVEAHKLEAGQYGEKLKYDPAGPFQKARVRTDFCWCIGFSIFLLVWLIIIIYGFSNGNVEKWLEPLDSEGRACGKDPGVEQKPYLLRYNNETCDDCLICTHLCPEVDFEYLFSSREVKKEEEGAEKEPASTDENNSKKPDNVKENANNDEKKDDASKETPKTELEKAGNKNKRSTHEDEKVKNEKESETSGTHEAGKEAEKPSTDGKEAEKPSTGGKDSDDKNKEPIADNKGSTNNEPSVTEKKPGEGEGEKEHGADEVSHEDSPKMGSDENDDVSTRKKYMLCKPEVQMHLVESFPELDHLVRTKKCAQTYRKTHETVTGGRCNDAHGEVQRSRYEVSRMSRDLSNTKFSITGFVFISAVMALISIFVMRWFALFFICNSIFIAIAVLFYVTYEKIVSDSVDKTMGVLLALFVCIVMVVFFVLLVLYLRKEIFKSCNMIKESSKAITGLLWTLLFPVLIAFLYGMILTMGVNLYFALSSIETPIYQVDFEPGDQCICPPELGYTQNASCDPVTFDSSCFTAEKKKCAASRCYLVRYEPHPVGFLHFINFVGLFWSFWFCLGLVDSVLANVFSNWYWTFNKKILTYVTLIEGVWTIGLYHLGTIALGSIIILICEIIQCTLSFFCKILEKINQPFTALILMHMRWAYDLLETFLNYINSRAYVACAMHGTDFLNSARSAYYLMMRNLNKVYRVAEISNWLTFILALMISLVVSKISVSYYQSREDEVTFVGVPSFFVFVGSLLVTWMMLRVVEVAVETIFQCFLEDSERNDGSCDKPFFASEQLSKILYKRQI